MARKRTLVLDAVSVELDIYGRIRFVLRQKGGPILEHRLARDEAVGVVAHWLMSGTKKGSKTYVRRLGTSERWVLQCRPVRKRGDSNG